MINIVYIEKEASFSQANCDEFLNKQVNVIRHRDQLPYVTNTSRIATTNTGGYTAQLSVGRLLGEDELTLPDETLFVITDATMYDPGRTDSIDKIVKDAGFDPEHARYFAYDGANGITSFVFASGGMFKDMVAKSANLWQVMPKADPSWEAYKC